VRVSFGKPALLRGGAKKGASQPPCPMLSPSEALAALLAFGLATSLGLSSFILEGDSLNITLALQHPTSTTD
jgi:hypothetical protein